MRLASSIARVAGSFQVFVRRCLRPRGIPSDCFSAPAAVSRSSSVAAAIEGNATAHATAPKPLAGTRSAVPLGATNEARSALATTPEGNGAGDFGDAK